MKKNCWLILGAMISTSLLAQPIATPPPVGPVGATAPALTNTPAPPPTTTPPPSAAGTNAPASKAGTKKAGGTKRSSTQAPAAAKKAPSAAAALRSVPLTPGPATVVGNNVNVRGKAGLIGEVVAHLTKDQLVTVLEEVARTNSGPEEPSAWAKILLPTNAHIWVSASYVDTTNMTVKATKLNLRSGAGENYSVLGTLQKGDVVKQINTKSGWLEIEPPSNAFAYVAAAYLKQETPSTTTRPPEIASTPPTVATTPPPETTRPPEVVRPPEETRVPETAIVAAPPSDIVTTPPFSTPPVTPPVEISSTVTPPVETAALTNSSSTDTNAVAEEPPIKRIVQHEGFVRGTVSIQAPTRYELVSMDTRQIINYLHTTSADLDLGRWKGHHVIVTGEEGLDDRWLRTPVLTIHSIVLAPDEPASSLRP